MGNATRGRHRCFSNSSPRVLNSSTRQPAAAASAVATSSYESSSSSTSSALAFSNIYRSVASPAVAPPPDSADDAPTNLQEAGMFVQSGRASCDRRLHDDGDDYDHTQVARHRPSSRWLTTHAKQTPREEHQMRCQLTSESAISQQVFAVEADSGEVAVTGIKGPSSSESSSESSLCSPTRTDVSMNEFFVPLRSIHYASGYRWGLRGTGRRALFQIHSHCENTIDQIQENQPKHQKRQQKQQGTTTQGNLGDGEKKNTVGLHAQSSGGSAFADLLLDAILPAEIDHASDSDN